MPDADQPLAGLDAARAAQEAAEAAAIQAAADLAAIERPGLAAAVDALRAPDLVEVLAAVRAALASVADPEVRQALTNIDMIVASARQVAAARLALRDAAIAAAAPAEPAA